MRSPNGNVTTQEEELLPSSSAGSPPDEKRGRVDTRCEGAGEVVEAQAVARQCLLLC